MSEPPVELLPWSARQILYQGDGPRSSGTNESLGSGCITGNPEVVPKKGHFRVGDRPAAMSGVPKSVPSSVPKCEGPRAPSFVVWKRRKIVATRPYKSTLLHLPQHNHNCQRGEHADEANEKAAGVAIDSDDGAGQGADQ